MATSLEKMQTAAIAIVALSAVVLTGLAVVTGFKDTKLIDNETADEFIDGLTVFATFVGVLVLAIVGKYIIGLFTKDGM